MGTPGVEHVGLWDMETKEDWDIGALEGGCVADDGVSGCVVCGDVGCGMEGAWRK